MYCWLKRRGKGRVFYLFFAKNVAIKPYSLRTTDRTLARKIQRKVETDIAEGRYAAGERVEAIVYSDLCRRFIESRVAKNIGEETIKTYKATLNLFGGLLGRDVFIRDITPEMIERFISHRRASTTKHGRPLKAKSLQNEIVLLATLFGWADKRDYLNKNPMDKVERPKRVISDTREALTREGYLALKEQLERDLELSDLVDFYLLSGVRRSDALEITSECYDFENMVVTLPQGKQKNHKQLPLSSGHAEVARRIIQRVGIGKPFLRCDPDKLTRSFNEARDKAGLPGTIKLHCLRHTFASWLAAEGTDFKTLQSLTGHSSAQALEVYLHSYNPNRRSAIEKLTIPRKAANE